MLLSLMNVCFWILSTIITLVCLFLINRYRKTRKLYQECKRRNVEFLPGTGNTLMAMYKNTRIELDLDNLVKNQDKRVFAYNNGDDSVTIFVAVPELIQQVLSKEFTNFVNRRRFPFKDKIMSDMLFFVEDEQWKRLRSIITPAFSTGKMKRMKPLIDETARTMMDNFHLTIQKSPIINVKKLLGAFTMDTIVKTAMGIHLDSLTDVDNVLVKQARKLFSHDFGIGVVILILLTFYFPFLAKIEYLRVNYGPIQFFYDSSKKIIQQKRKQFITATKPDDDKRPMDFLELMIEAEMNLKDHQEGFSSGNVEPEDNQDQENSYSLKKSSKYITEAEMLSQAVLFFMAGYDTTATTITMACYCLALNPAKQQILYEEIESVILEIKTQHNHANDNEIFGLITWEQLQQRFEYLTAVINETLRLHAPIPFVERRAAEDIHLETADGKYKIDLKQGDNIHVAIYSLHHDREQFPEPEEFRPERFLASSPSANMHHKYSFLPFGLGPRNCVAKSLGMLEAKMALIRIVYQYKLMKCDKTPIPPKFHNRPGFLTPKNIFIRAEPRG